ncbi:hypothetical protein NQ318_012394 [Aromia moschata]|uniref:Large ribosomal subunit protein uL30m n=1 Tax=Aromia moschata TaxID=1265417 RepID=A0AAV8Y2I5_9CUCU|nr:hypothetical protein NQ318_012394 [Aromia moschata]
MVNCPLSSKMTSCSPKCKGDSECFGRKCCPNICNTKSCVPANMKLDSSDGYKNQNAKTATGSYCGNVKCNSFERCELDRATKRQRCRNVGKCKFNWYGEGIQYPGFKYYPRRPDFKDPPYEPSKLFRVERIKSLKGVPYWEKNILKEFKLDGLKNNCYVVIKNIPENNNRLWKVKHLVKITPITFPDGFPSESDRTVLHENGELRIIKTIERWSRNYN